MDFIVYVLETWGHFLPILLIKTVRSNYFKLNSIVVEERIKSVTSNEWFNLPSLQNGEGSVSQGEGDHFLKLHFSW